MDYIDRIQNSIDFIEANIKYEITLEEMAEKSFLSKYYFHRLFTILTGKRPMEYIRNRRLVLAAKDLSETDKSVLEIAIDYGFESEEVFTRAFNKFF